MKEKLVGPVKDQSSRTPESSEVFISSIQRTRILRRSSKMHGKIGSTDRSSYALQKGKVPEQGDLYSKR